MLEGLYRLRLVDGDLEECYRDTARAMTEGDEYKLRCQLSVQLNGQRMSTLRTHSRKR